MTTIRELIEQHGSIRAVSRAIGVPYTTVWDNLQKEKFSHLPEYSAEDVKISGSEIRYYIFTSAVFGQALHTDFYNNLQAYAESLGAELVVGAVTNVGSMARSPSIDEFDLGIELNTTPMNIGKKIRWCPELNIAASTVKPLTGLQTYSKDMWAVFPHPKVSLDAIPTHKHKPAKQIATTGAVTLPHYAANKSGHRAKFDHVCAALIVEVTSKGVWMRHIHATSHTDGTFYDLDNIVDGGVVRKSPGVSALVYGDIHIEDIDPVVYSATWGVGGIAYKLEPTKQIVHDLIDFDSIKHHDLNNIFARYYKRVKGKDDPVSAVADAVEFLKDISVYSDETYVIESNHDHFVPKWLNQSKPSTRDLDQAIAYHKLMLGFLQNAEDDFRYTPLEVTISALLGADILDGLDDFNIAFLPEDASLMIGNTECGWHGHKGPNGSRPGKTSFTYVTEQTMTGHRHSPSIYSGSYIVGTSSKLDLAYNKGPSSWAHTHGVIYPNGRKALLTLSAGRFYAGQ